VKLKKGEKGEGRKREIIVLHIVVTLNLPKYFAYALNNNLDINVGDKFLKIPISYTVVVGHAEYVALFIAYGVKSDTDDNCELTPIHVAAGPKA
jgi:hypothetical protein